MKLMEQVTQTRQSELDNSYHAALYLMASEPSLAEKISRYITRDGIDFPVLMKKERFDYDWMKTVADAAHNLFSWTSKCGATPFELSRLPHPYTQMVCNAMFVANGDYEVKIRQNEQEQDEIVLDNTRGRQREAIESQFERFTAGMEQ